MTVQIDPYCPMCGHSRQDEDSQCWTDDCECECRTVESCLACRATHLLRVGFCLQHRFAIVSDLSSDLARVVCGLAKRYGVTVEIVDPVILVAA